MVENIRKITVVFRYDDYSTLSQTDLETKLIDLFQKYKVSCTFGIIPYVASDDVHSPCLQEVIPLSEEKVYIVKTAMGAGIVEPALHGYSHQTIRDCKKGGCTEFSGLSYEKQMEKIKKGKEFLEEKLDTKISIFIPPWNSYDTNTLYCLEKLGFNCISAGLHGVQDENLHLKFLPATVSISELQQAINSVRQSSISQPLIIVLFHGYDFIEGDNERGKFTYLEFSNLLSWITSQKDVCISSMGQLINEDDLESYRFQKNKKYFLIRHFNPFFILRSLNVSRFYFSHISLTMAIKICKIVVTFALLILLISAIALFITLF